MPQVHRSFFRLVPLVLPLWLVSLTVAEEPQKAPPKDYIRFEEDATGARLQTGIATFRNAQGVTVDLIGAIHVADHAYYAKLNERFTHYDAMLYEMVGGPVSRRSKRLAHAASETPSVKTRTPAVAPPASSAKQSSKIPTAVAEASMPGFVFSPYADHRLVYVKDAAPGSTFTCPYTQRPFLIPPSSKDKTLEERVQALENYFQKSDPRIHPPVTDTDSDNDAEDDSDEEAASHRLAWLGGMTSMMQSSLGLESQLKGIDYYRPNFVHADMSLTQFFKLQDARNEGFFALWWRSVKAQMEHPEMESNQPGLLKILEILRSKDRSIELKRLIGRTFDSVEMLMAGVEGKNGTVIIAERNKVALHVLQQQIAQGKKKLAIFYGAAHLNDMQRRLEAMGFTRTHHEWMTAWNLPPEAASASDAPVESSKAEK